MRFSQDSRLLFVGNFALDGNNPLVDVWDWQTGERLHTLTGHAINVIDMEISPDGNLIAIGDQGNQLIIWDIQKGEPIHTLEGHLDWVTGVVFSPDGQVLYSASQDRTIRQWDVATGEMKILLEYSSSLRDLDVSQDGTQLLVPTDDTAILVDIATGQVVRRYDAHDDGVTGAIFSPDESLILTWSWDTTLILWDAATAQPLQRLVGHMEGDGDFYPPGSFLSNEQILSYTAAEIIIWDVLTLQEEFDVWLLNNRYVPDFTCEQRALYVIEPQCETQQ